MEDEVKKTVPRSTVMMRVIWAILGIFMLITVISQIVIHVYEPVKTEVATLYTSSSSVLFKGIYIRNEKLIDYNGGGVVSYVLADGSKLAKNSVVAKVYKTQNDITLQSEIDHLNEQISVLKDAESLLGSDSSQLEAFSNQIYEEHTKLLSHIENGEYSSAAQMKNDLLNLYCKKQIVTGYETGYSDKIAQLQERIKLLEGQISSPPKDLIIGETGYFVSVVDGYENTLNYDSIPDLTEEQIKNIIENPEIESADNIIGKFIDGYKWKFVGLIETKEILGIFDGANVTLKAGSSSGYLSATVETVTKLDDGMSIVVFSSDKLSTEYVDRRVTQFRLLMNENTGIRVPAEAIRFNENGEKGVFIKSGIEIRFRLVSVISSEDDYVLVEDTTDKSGYISLYDNVVTEGKDLYDGKIIY